MRTESISIGGAAKNLIGPFVLLLSLCYFPARLPSYADWSRWCVGHVFKQARRRRRVNVWFRERAGERATRRDKRAGDNRKVNLERDD